MQRRRALSTPAIRTAPIEVMQWHTVQRERARWMQWGMGRPETSVGASQATTGVRMWLLKAGRSNGHRSRAGPSSPHGRPLAHVGGAGGPPAAAGPVDVASGSMISTARLRFAAASI